MQKIMNFVRHKLIVMAVVMVGGMGTAVALEELDIIVPGVPDPGLDIGGGTTTGCTSSSTMPTGCTINIKGGISIAGTFSSQTYNYVVCNSGSSRTCYKIEHATCKSTADTHTDYITFNTLTVKNVYCSTGSGGGGSVLPDNPGIVNCTDAMCDANVPAYSLNTWSLNTSSPGINGVTTTYWYKSEKDGCYYDSSTEKCMWSYKIVASCAAGYYGTPSCSKSGITVSCSGECTACPEGGGSDLGDSNTVKKCYKTDAQDANGNKYKFSGSCYYTE